MTDFYLHQFKTLENQTSNMIIKQSKEPNLTIKEAKALITLKKNKNIVIIPADKGPTVVIMDKRNT